MVKNDSAVFLVPKNVLLNTNLSLKLEEISKINQLLLNKSPNRASQNKQRGRMRPAGRQFDMPALNGQKKLSKFV